MERNLKNVVLADLDKEQNKKKSKKKIFLFEVHDFLEVRNVIVHNDSHPSEQYFERMRVYNQKLCLNTAMLRLRLIFRSC